MSQTSQSLKWKIQFFTPHLSPTRSDRSRLWYTLVALGQNNHQHLSWWFACLSHTQFHIPVKRRQGPRGWKPISCFCSIKTVWHTCSLSLWPAGSHRTGETWLNCEAMDRRVLFSPPSLFILRLTVLVFSQPRWQIGIWKTWETPEKGGRQTALVFTAVITVS